ncbi:hypothetical protein PRUPE_5G068000 [Prunus persica]|uniref:Agenet domain-containing protein n=1 Tax=Prunus persica TaxID=3760 RepID=A0A251P4N8_PRUPE|nr:uncharacterized protein LOC18777292 isoform X2 [Prunus persica]ONI06562.1 hypothetical protein PRUPE_5G068000 [Prunus persica]ONI06563.1 hypothetical protein PRUPE_5G068000 [Prunus persica]ONI06564.1 hypothetical protein PRUPE_5G068000 [Prunus persica]
MDYDDNDFQSQNLHLAGEGNTNYPPVLRPYALPKFEFDDSLHGHLRFDSLVETEVFLGIESSETNHWIEDFSRGSSGIEFNSSAAESCSISRRNNVWSEATSSESVEMLLKSVGQEEIIPPQTIFEELDACKELHCLTKQMEPSFNNDDNILSQMEDVTDLQPTLPQDDIPENISGIEDVGVDQLRVEDASQTHEGKLSVAGNSGDLDPNALSGNDSPHVTKGSLLADGKCKDADPVDFDNLFDEPPDKREDSCASGMQIDGMTTSVQNIMAIGDELNNKDVQHNIKNVNEENPGGHVLSIETQNMNEKAGEKVTCHLENPHCSASEVESIELGIANQDSVINVEEQSSVILQGDSNLHMLGGCSDRVNGGVLADTNKCEDMVSDIGIDQSKLNTHDLSPIAYKIDTGYAVEVSNNNAEISSSLEPTLKGDSDLHMVDGCSDRECRGVPAETNKCEDMVLFKDTDTGDDNSKLNTHDLSSVVYRSDDRYAVEVSNSNAGISSSLESMLKVDSGQSSSKENASESSFRPDSEILVKKFEVSLSVIKENDVSKDESEENKEDHSNLFNLTATCSSAEIVSEAHVTGASKSPHDSFGVSGEKSNVDGASFSILGESTQICDENEVYRDGDVGDGNLDLSHIEKDNTQLFNESNNTELEIGGSVDKEFQPSSVCEGSAEKELIVPKLKHGADDNESVANVSLENPDLASCVTMDAVPSSSGNGTTTNINRSEVEAETSPDVGPHSDKKQETANKMSKDASFPCIVSSPLAEIGPGSVSEVGKGVSCDTSGPLLCKRVDQSLPVTDSCNTECQNEPQTAVATEVSKRSTNEMEASSVQCESSENDGDGAGATIKDSFEKASANVKDPIMNCDTNVTQRGPSLLVEICGGSAKKVLEDTDTSEVSGDKGSAQDAVPSINSDASMICEGSTCSAALPESHTGFVAPESGRSSVDPHKPDCVSPKVVGTTEPFETKHELGNNKGPTNQSAPVSDTVGDGGNYSPNSQNPNGNDAFKDRGNGTSDVSLSADLPKADTANIVQRSPAIPSPKIVEGSKENSGSGQLDAKISQDISHGGPLVSGGDIGRGGSKSTPERRTRRAPSKATGKPSAKKGSMKATTPVRQSERGDKSISVSQNQSGIFQLVQPSETQPYGHVDGSIKPYSVLTTSTSSLPDLNTSAPQSVIFQQPFTDLQQVQLRAQIFVYGALIQGIAPEEAYMVSAFGGPDGGRGMWENAWRVCIERLHGQKSTPINPETPLQSRSGSRASDQVIKQGALHNKGLSSPVGRASTKGTPQTASPMIPISSPLWSISTPVCEGLQYSVIPRGSVMDYQQGFNPLHPFQTPSVKNLVGHNTTWMPQSSFRGPWLPSPQSSAEASMHFSAFPSTEAVQLTPIKEVSLPQLPTVKHVPSGPSAQTGGPISAFAGPSPLLDPKKVSASPGQHSADPKPRKRKKISPSEELGQISLQAQSQPESALTVAVVSSTTPSTLSSKAMPDKLIMSVPPMSSSDQLKKADLDLEQRATLSEETLAKVKEARQQAEEASSLAAAAVSHSQAIWNQLEKQKNSKLISDGEAKLASAAVAVAAAAAVAKAAAAAANVASNAALQAKLMAEEALDNYENPSPSMRMATPVSILRGEDGTNSSSSILVAAREAARRKVVAASAASKRAENLDAIVKAAELAAEAVSQAGTIVAMGDPLPLSELAEAGPEGYWKVPQVSSELITKSNDMVREQSNVGTVEEDAGTSARHSKDRQSDKKEAQPTPHEKLPIPIEVNRESTEDHLRSVVGVSGFDIVNEKGSKGPKGRKVSEIGSKSALMTVENDFEKEEHASEESGIKEGSLVEVLKDGGGFGAAWFTANVLSLQDGKACVCYTELQSDEGSGKLQEWVALESKEDKPPKIRIARPVTALGFEGTRKRRRAAMADYAWSVGDKVDAWIQDSWWEGVVTEKNKKDETILTVHFPAQGEKSVVKAWHLRPSLIWKDGEWVEWFSVRNDCVSHEGDMPQEKRPKLGSPAVEGKGKDKTSKSIDIVDSGKPEEPRLLNLSANEKVFNMGKNTRTENKPDPTRTIRTGLQKEGAKVVYGIPKPGKKRKFMEVSKHYVANQSTKINETNDSMKFAKYLMPQGSGSRGLKNTSKIDTREKQVTESKLKGLKSIKPQGVPSKSVPQKDNLLTDARTVSDGSSEMDHTGKIKDSVSRVDSVSGKHTLSQPEGPIVFSSLAPSSDFPSSKKVSASTAKSRSNKGNLAPAGAKLGKIEEGKVFSGNPAKSTSEVAEPRRSNRRIQPTSRLLEGLQSSLIITKIPSGSHDKGHRSQNRNASRGNNNG